MFAFIMAILSGFFAALVEYSLSTVMGTTEDNNKRLFIRKRSLKACFKDGAIIAVMYFILSLFW